MKQTHRFLTMGFLILLVACGSEKEGGTPTSGHPISPAKTGGEVETQPETNLDPSVLSQNLDLLPFIVYYDITMQKLLNMGRVVSDEDIYQGQPVEGYNYLEQKSDDGSGWIGMNFQQGADEVVGNEEILKIKIITDLHSYPANLSCGMGEFILNGILKCDFQKTIDILTNDWDAFGTCITETLSATTTDGRKVHTLRANVRESMGRRKRSEFSGSYIWDGNEVDLNILSNAVIEKNCVPTITVFEEDF